MKKVELSSMKSSFKSRPLPPIGRMDTDNQSPTKHKSINNTRSTSRINTHTNVDKLDNENVNKNTNISSNYNTNSKYNLPTASSMMNTFTPMNSYGNIDYTIKELKERQEFDPSYTNPYLYTDSKDSNSNSNGKDDNMISYSSFISENLDLDHSAEKKYFEEEPKSQNIQSQSKEKSNIPQQVLDSSSNQTQSQSSAKGQYRRQNQNYTKLSSVEELMEQQKMHEKQLKELQMQIQLQRKQTQEMEKSRIKYPSSNPATLRKESSTNKKQQQKKIPLKPLSSPLKSEQGSSFQYHIPLQDQQNQLLPNSAHSFNNNSTRKRILSDVNAVTNGNGMSKSKIKFVPDVNFIKKRIEKKRRADILSESNTNGRGGSIDATSNNNNNNNKLPMINKVSNEMNNDDNNNNNNSTTYSETSNKMGKNNQLLTTNDNNNSYRVNNSKISEVSCFEDKKALIRKQYSDRRKLVEADLEKDLKLIKELESKLFQLQNSKAGTSSVMDSDDITEEERIEQGNNNECTEDNFSVDDMLKFAAQYPLESPDLNNKSDFSGKVEEYFNASSVSTTSNNKVENETDKITTQTMDNLIQQPNSIRKDACLSKDFSMENEITTIQKQTSLNMQSVTQITENTSMPLKDEQQTPFENVDNAESVHAECKKNEEDWVITKTLGVENQSQRISILGGQSNTKVEEIEKKDLVSTAHETETNLIQSLDFVPNHAQSEPTNETVDTEKEKEPNKIIHEDQSQNNLVALSQLSKENISQVLVTNSLSIYVENFIKNGVDGEVLSDPTLTEDDLIELGVNIRLHRRRILSLLATFKDKGVHKSQYTNLSAGNFSLEASSGSSLNVRCTSASPLKENIDAGKNEAVKQQDKNSRDTQPALDEEDMSSDSSDSDNDGYEGPFSKHTTQSKPKETETSSSIFGELTSPSKHTMGVGLKNGGGIQNLSPSFGKNFFFSPSKKRQINPVESIGIDNNNSDTSTTKNGKMEEASTRRQLKVKRRNSTSNGSNNLFETFGNNIRETLEDIFS